MAPGGSAPDAPVDAVVDAAIDAAEFDRLMQPLGPFEAAPRLAVAVSGGADSLALTLLAADWAAARGGRVDALTVDHGLRPESATEAAQVGAILTRHRIPHAVLRWAGPRPAAGLQEAARAARHALLEEWCAASGVLHLLLAHHREDQAETFLLRLARGSGAAGLAGMAAVAERRAVRLLRPLLAVPKARLRATLEGRGERWISDPSNENPAFDRVRIRRLLPQLAAHGLAPERLAGTARRLGRARQALEAATAEALAAAVSLRPEGYAWVDLAALAGRPAEIRLRALAAVVMCIGGLAATPRLARLERLEAALLAPAAGRRRTLGGCLVSTSGPRALVCREPAALAGPLAVAGCGPFHWDGRFRLVLAADPRGPLTLRALGAEGWRAAVADLPALARTALPAPVRPTLPSLWDSRGLLAIPQLGYRRMVSPAASVAVESLLFSPLRPLAGPAFVLA